MKEILKTALILFAVCALAAASLSFVNLATKDRIAAHHREAREAAMKQVAPEAESFSEKSSGNDWDALKAGEVVGSVHLVKTPGYSGIIEIMFGEDATGELTGVRVLTQTETPGLGAKIATAGYLDQYKGKTVDQVVLKKDDPSKGAIDAITAATISSRAVTRRIHDAMAANQPSGGK